MKKTKDILIITFALIVVSVIAYLLIGIFVVQDRYENEPESLELAKEKRNTTDLNLQTNRIALIEKKVTEIESDATLTEVEFDLLELTGRVTDGGGMLKLWRNQNQTQKIIQEVGLSFGRISTTVYLENKIPIKVIETEENFESNNGELDYSKLNEVFKATSYFFDWEQDDSNIELKGKRVLSQGNCTAIDYKPILEMAKKAISK